MQSVCLCHARQWQRLQNRGGDRRWSLVTVDAQITLGIRDTHEESKGHLFRSHPALYTDLGRGGCRLVPSGIFVFCVGTSISGHAPRL